MLLRACLSLSLTATFKSPGLSTFHLLGGLLNRLPSQLLPLQPVFCTADREVFLKHNSDPGAPLVKTFNASLVPSSPTP